MRGLPYGDQGIFVRRETFFELGPFAEVPILEDLILARALRPEHGRFCCPARSMSILRRWRRHGIVRQTLRNWSLVTAYRLAHHPSDWRLTMCVTTRSGDRPVQVPRWIL